MVPVANVLPIGPHQKDAMHYRCLALTLVLVVASSAEAGPKVQFNRDVRPILSENCFLCHGPDAKVRKAKLRLDDRDVAIAKKAIVPGNVEESALVARINSTDENVVMPPPSTHKELTKKQKDTLRQWIAEGAEYQPHWAYVLIARPEVPEVKDKNWIRNPIDNFILANLEGRGIKPSPAADQRTLLRRLSLDLVGLPPSMHDVRRFAGDPRAEAYDEAVSRLLASPHFGERLAIPWLDLVRFTDTVGYHGDQNQDCFPYRDYVIDSFNKNKPFDRFTIEQLAGDLLPNPTPEQLVATCFNRLNMMTREGGAQPKEYLAKYQADRVRTVSITWLGSTMGCAECHNHKYDPFTAKDFYSMEAFFADVKQWGVYQDYGYTPNPDLRGWSNDHPFPPEIEVTSPALQRRAMALVGKINDVCSAAEAKKLATESQRQAFEQWQATTKGFLDKHHSDWIVPPTTIQASPEDKSKEYVEQDDKSIVITGKGKRSDEHKFDLELEPGWLASIRLELLPHETHKGSIVRTGENTTIQFSAVLKDAQGKETRLGFYHADADFKEPRYANGYDIIGITGAWRTSAKHKMEKQTGVWLLDKPQAINEGEHLLISLKSDQLGCVRLSVSPFGFMDPNRPQRSGPDYLYFRSTFWDPDLASQYKSLYRELLECRDGKAMVMVTEAQQPLTTRLLPRGNWLDESGEIVQPSVPGFLPQPSNPDGKRLTRLDLANWLVSKDNPLTARVFVNRLWKMFFGNGISGVMEDVGGQGEPPVHPELLDWLASEFRDSGWDVKHIVRLMVTSNVYRQSSKARPELRDLDPNNRWLAYQSPRRLEAEFVRDNALAIACLLDLEMGGPSVRPYQPAGYYVNLQFPDRNYQAHKDERQYRRGIYTHWQRTFLHPMLANFDAPPREECTASRSVANTPQQALTLLNDPTFVEASRVLAAKIMARSSVDADRIDDLYERALARSPKPTEKESLTKFLATQREYYGTHPEEAQKLLKVGLAPLPGDVNQPDLAAWTQVCRVVLNLHETITRY